MKYVVAILLAFSSLSALGEEHQQIAPSPFEIAQPTYELNFPNDHGSHPKYQTEWWYFTGQLFEKDKAPFKDSAAYGFQLTFFRRAVANSPESGDVAHAFLAHAALTDISAQSFDSQKRYQRGGYYTAHAKQDGLDVAVGDWSAQQRIDGAVVLRYTINSKSIEIVAKNAQSVMLQGEGGYSKKGSCESCASIYYSMPRLILGATITEGGVSKTLHGIGWMDHEFMSSALEPEQVGWDWFSVIFKDGRSLMYFRLRSNKKGEERVAATLFDRGASLELTDVASERLSFVTTNSGTRYPASWRIRSAQAGIDVTVSSLVPDQEIKDKDMNYFEGAIASPDRQALGYAELTGYDKPITQRF